MKKPATVARLRDEAPAIDLMVREVREGLRRPLPELPSKYFYDNRGSRLFEQITTLPEYYPTRVELGILERVAREVIDLCAPREIVELGSGAGRKIRLLLDAARRHGTRRLVFFDISEGFLSDSLARLRQDYPELVGKGIVGDFSQGLAPLGPGSGRLLVFFGGTLGNFPPSVVPAFFRDAAERLGAGDHFLVGVDLVKDVDVLEAAYNDAEGVTAEFNRNILHVMNRRLGATFAPESWEHVAFFDAERSWIEMRLRATARQDVRVPACGLDLRFESGDEIRTEISCKYTRRSFASTIAGSGLAEERWYTDAQSRFALVLLRREAGA